MGAESRRSEPSPRANIMQHGTRYFLSRLVKPVRVGFSFALLLLALVTGPSQGLIDRASAHEGQKVPSEYTQILKWLQVKEYDKAINACKQLIVKQPEFDRAYAMLVEAYEEKGELEKATSYFQTLLDQDPRRTYAYYGLARVSFQKKE